MQDLGNVAQVLGRFYAPLAYGIQNPASIPLGKPHYPYGAATQVAPVKMRPDEINTWDKLFGITDKVMAAGKAIVVTDTDIPLAELDMARFEWIRKIKDDRPPRPEGNVALYGNRYCKFFPFESDGMELYIQPHAHLERREDGAGLYTSTMMLRFFVADREGRLALTKPRPMRGGIPSGYETIWLGDVLTPYEPIDARLIFNTEIRKDEAGKPPIKNSLEIGLNTDAKLVLLAELHKPGEIGEIMVPDNPKVQLFFDQIAAFLRPREAGDNTIDNLFQTEGRIQ